MAPFDATINSREACKTLASRDQVLDKSSYPCNSASVLLPLHDLGYLQKIVSNESNFAPAAKCDVFEIDEEGAGHWVALDGDEALCSYLDGELSRTNELSARLLFFHLEKDAASTFDWRVSIGQACRQRIMQSLKMNPHFITFLLGLYAVNHIPPVGLENVDPAGQIQSIDFICQQPRWGFRERIPPISTLTSVGVDKGPVTCITTASLDDPRLNTVKSRLTAAFTGQTRLKAGSLNAREPFMLKCLITHECFMASDYRIVELAGSLFGVVDKIDESRDAGFDRGAFKDMTFTLHRVSQDADFLISSVEIGLMMMDTMIEAKSTMLQHGDGLYSRMHPDASLTFLRRAMESRRRWLYNAKSKKDTAMNLVYNIVSQQDTEANIAIAKDTKHDSSSMKTIAVLTMVFLPASTMASVFGMAFFNNDGGNIVLAPQAWIFIAITVPTTLLVLLIWWIWQSQVADGRMQRQMKGLLAKRRPWTRKLKEKLDQPV